MEADMHTGISLLLGRTTMTDMMWEGVPADIMIQTESMQIDAGTEVVMPVVTTETGTITG